MEEMKTTILQVVAILTALGAIVDFTFLPNGLLNKLKRYLLFMLKTRRQTMITVFRLAMINPTLSLEDRIEAGEIYLELGGNGSGEEYFRVLKELAQCRAREEIIVEESFDV